ncbi:MAG TPA: DNA polymerase III subunit delta' [Burkholderiales bacterium]|nr:DNA polymerase III subunit delta' [Burkholderiales bacterium]
MHTWNQPIFDSLVARLERLPHALLLFGPRGVGKLALAERVSQLLLCEGTGKKPCDACDACRWFRAGNHPDFRRLEPEALAKEPPPADPDDEAPAASKKTKQPSIVIKVEQVRGLADFLYVRSHRGRLRVALVHPADDMNENAANALFKGLEEPPAGAVFILVSHRPAQLLPTIRSRCVAVPVPLPSREAALAWLSSQPIKDPARWLAYAGGAPLRALEYAAQGQVALAPTDAREALEPLADALQKIALDRALAGFGLPPKYQAGGAKVSREKVRDWLTFARRMGEDRLLCRHPLNPRLFSSAMLAAMPRDEP